MDRQTVCYRLHGDGGPRCYLKPEKKKKKKGHAQFCQNERLFVN